MRAQCGLDQLPARRAAGSKIGRECGQTEPWLKRKSGHRPSFPFICYPAKAPD